MLVMQGRNCFFTVDGNGFSVDYWWCCCFYLQPLVTYKMDKWVAGFQKQRFLFQRGLQLHGNVQDGFVLANTVALVCQGIGRMGKSIKQERIIPDRSALLMSYPIAPQPVGRFFSILSGSLRDSMVLFSMSLNCYTCKSIFHDCLVSCTWIERKIYWIPLNLCACYRSKIPQLHNKQLKKTHINLFWGKETHQLPNAMKQWQIWVVWLTFSVYNTV